MTTILKRFIEGKSFLVVLVLIGTIIGFLPVFGASKGDGNSENIVSPAELAEELDGKLVILQNNSLLPFSSVSSKNKIKGQIRVVATAYSSTFWETDSNPFITAAGTQVRDGIIANNYLPIGTKIRIPELYGEKIFVVEDRMNWRKGKYQIDIWFPSHWEALNFGAQNTYIEILEG